MKKVSSISYAGLALSSALFGCAVEAPGDAPEKVRQVSQAQITTVQRTISAGAQDVEERQSGSMSLNSSDLELGQDGSNSQIVGMHFTGLNIPVDAVISNAYIEFTVDEASLGAADLTFRAEAIDNASGFNSATFNLSRRARSIASVRWTPEEWPQNSIGSKKQSPNLAPLIQEVVNRGGWSPNQAINILVSGSGRRTAEALENGTSSKAPKLVVEYNQGNAELFCHINFCATSSGGDLPHNLLEGEYWDPCNGGAFTWSAEYDFEPNYDFFAIDGDVYDGRNATASGSADGPVHITVSTDHSIGSGGIAQLEATCSSNGQSVSHYLESECESVALGGYTTIHTSDSDYSGPGYVQSAGNTYDVATSTDSLNFSFRSSADTYAFYFRVNPYNNGSKDSWFYQVDEGPWVTMNGFSNLSGFNWIEGANDLVLTAGLHNLRIKNRESGLSLDKFAVLPSSQPAPSNRGGAAYNCTPTSVGVSCGSQSCGAGQTCCGGFSENGSFCSNDYCQADHPITCDSHTDCGAGYRCMFQAEGNQAFRFTCLEESELPYYSFVREICESPGWSGSCPSNQDCTGNQPLGYKFCEDLN